MALPTKLTLNIVTPDHAYSHDVDEVSLPGTEGDFGVLPGHTPLFAALRTGQMYYRQGTLKHFLAVSIGFVISFVLAYVAYRMHWLETPIGWLSGLLYTIPSLALFQLLVPVTGLTVTTVEVALVGYTLLILFRNILEGLRSVPPDVLEAARGMGLTRRQTLWRIELPLAVPATMAGLRVAVVSTIALATIAALVIPQGLGYPIFVALHEAFKTEILVAGALAVGLALVADALLVVAERALTPWNRSRRAT